MDDPIREIIRAGLEPWPLLSPSTACIADAVIHTLHAAGYTIVRDNNVNQMADDMEEAEG